MSDVQRDRLFNFRRIATARGLTPQSLSDRLGSRYSYWRDLLAGQKSFGEKMARRIEEGLDLPLGWLDQYMSKFDAGLKVNDEQEGNDMMQFQDRLKLAMEIGGIGCEATGMRALAEYLGITGSAVSQALKGQTKFNARNSARAARMLRVDLYWFATGEGAPRDERYAKVRQRNRCVTINKVAFAKDGAPKTPKEFRKWAEAIGVSAGAAKYA